jgi:hypothetical protein
MSAFTRITVNGLPENVPSSATIAELIDLFGEIDRDLIVEHNGRYCFPKTMVRYKWLPTTAWNSFTRISRIVGPKLLAEKISFCDVEKERLCSQKSFRNFFQFSSRSDSASKMRFSEPL